MIENNDKDLSLNRSIKMWNNIPIDSRQVTTSLNELDENINYPYIGMVFYSQFEDDYYKVTSLESGYRMNRSGKILRASEIDNPSSINEIAGYFVGSYEQYCLKKNNDSLIKKAYVDDKGYLHIVFNDDLDTNIGYVMGNSGYNPQIYENENNDMNTLSNLIYKLDIKYCDEISHLNKVLTTENLIGPYVVNILEELDSNGDKNGYINFILNNGTSYRIGPYGIKTFELRDNDEEKDLIIIFNDETELNLGNIRGRDGASFNLRGELESEDMLPINSEKGDSYVIDGYLYYYYNNWEKICKIIGNDGKTPNISIKTTLIQSDDNEDERDIVRINFYNGETKLDGEVDIKLAISPIINITNNTDDKYTLDFIYYDKEGIKHIISSPNLKGKDGNSINIKNSILSYLDLESYYQTANLGDSYIIDNINDPNDGHLWLFTNEENEDEKHYKGFTDIGKIKGPQGNDGKPGKNGYNIDLKINDNIIQWCYIDSKTNLPINEYNDLISLDAITGSDGISPTITVNNDNNNLTLTINDVNGTITTPNLKGKDGKDGINGKNGNNIEIKYEEYAIKYRYYILNTENDIIYPNGEEWNELCKIPKITTNKIENGLEITIDDNIYNILNGRDGIDGKNVNLRYNTENNYIEWNYTNDYNWNKLIDVNDITGKDGKNIEIGSINTNTLESNELASVNITLDNNLSTDNNNIYNFDFNIPKGEKGIQGTQGIGITSVSSNNSSDGILTDLVITTTNPKDKTTKNFTIPVGNIKGEKGEKGDTGEKGEDGTSVKIKGSLDDKNELASKVDSSDLGDGYLIDGYLWIYTNNNNENPNKETIYGFENVGNIQGPKGDNGENGESITITNTSKSNGITNITFSDSKIISINDGKSFGIGEVTSNSVESNIEPSVIINKSDISSDDMNNIYDFTFNIPKGIKGDKGDSITITSTTKKNGITNITFSDSKTLSINDGKSFGIGEVTSNSVESSINPSVIITKNENNSNNILDIYDFTFNIPKGIKGDKGDEITYDDTEIRSLIKNNSDNINNLEKGKVNIEDGKGLTKNELTDERLNNYNNAYEHSNLEHARVDATKVEKSNTNGNILINDNEVVVYTHPSGTNPHNTTKIDIGLSEVGNFKAVSTVENQELSEEEKINARNNIGAGTSSFSGNYTDLKNKPTIPTVNNSTITINQNGNLKGTFSLNQNGDTIIDLSDNNTTYKIFSQSGPNAASGLVPKPSTTASNTAYLCEDGTWKIPPDTNDIYTHPNTSGYKHIPSGGKEGQILRWLSDGNATWGNDNNTTYNNFVKSGPNAASGLVPKPSTTASNTAYLCEDGTWSTPENTIYTHPNNAGYKHIPSGGKEGQILRWLSDGTAAWGNDNNTTYNNFSGSGPNAASGLVPKPSATTSNTAYLCEDGTWKIPPDTNDIYTHPNNAGYKHIPSGGSNGQILYYSGSAGTAKWGNTDGTLSNTSTNAVQNKAVKIELDKKANKTADDLNTMINSLGVTSSNGTNPLDDEYYIAQYNNNGEVSYYRRPTLSLWKYIDSKLSDVATSGNYSDLSNKPSIPVVDSTLSNTSTNAIQNKIVTSNLDLKANKTEEDLNVMLKDLNNGSIATAAPFDDEYYLSQRHNDNGSTGAVLRKHSAIWNYIKGKFDTTLNTTSTGTVQNKVITTYLNNLNTLIVYVDDSIGNDNNNGLTKETAFKTLNKAISLLKTTNFLKVYINDGTYNINDQQFIGTSNGVGNVLAVKTLLLANYVRSTHEDTKKVKIVGCIKSWYNSKIIGSYVTFVSVEFPSWHTSQKGHIVIGENAEGYFTGCIFENNHYEYGINVVYSKLTITNCEFINNTSLTTKEFIRAQNSIIFASNLIYDGGNIKNKGIFVNPYNYLPNFITYAYNDASTDANKDRFIKNINYIYNFSKIRGGLYIDNGKILLPKSGEPDIKLLTCTGKTTTAAITTEINNNNFKVYKYYKDDDPDIATPATHTQYTKGVALFNKDNDTSYEEIGFTFEIPKKLMPGHNLLKFNYYMPAALDELKMEIRLYEAGSWDIKSLLAASTNVIYQKEIVLTQRLINAKDTYFDLGFIPKVLNDNYYIVFKFKGSQFAVNRTFVVRDIEINNLDFNNSDSPFRYI